MTLLELCLHIVALALSSLAVFVTLLRYTMDRPRVELHENMVVWSGDDIAVILLIINKSLFPDAVTDILLDNSKRLLRAKAGQGLGLPHPYQVENLRLPAKLEPRGVILGLLHFDGTGVSEGRFFLEATTSTGRKVRSPITVLPRGRRDPRQVH